jgi:hypothetical protein
VIDDYYAWSGARTGVDAYLSKRRVSTMFAGERGSISFGVPDR